MSATLEKTCFGTTKMPLRFTDTNSESRDFSFTRTVCGALLLDGRDVRSLARRAEDVHRRVLLAGGHAVDDVGGGQRLAVRPLDALAEVDRQRLAVLAPRVALGEPLVLAAATGRSRDHERLVHAAADEGRRGEALDVRVEVADERGIAGAGGDEAPVCGRRRPVAAVGAPEADCTARTVKRIAATPMPRAPSAMRLERTAVFTFPAFLSVACRAEGFVTEPCGVSSTCMSAVFGARLGFLDRCYGNG